MATMKLSYLPPVGRKEAVPLLSPETFNEDYFSEENSSSLIQSRKTMFSDHLGSEQVMRHFSVFQAGYPKTSHGKHATL